MVTLKFVTHNMTISVPFIR